MKLKKILLLSGIILLLAGCSTVSRPRATVMDRVIRNTSFGFSGYSLQIPEGFELYNPAEKNSAEYNELQRMAIRIYELNEKWHPRGNELFYESFLLLSDKTCFLWATVESAAVSPLEDSPFTDTVLSSWEILPLYNVASRRVFDLGAIRRSAVFTRGSACEQKGWYYAKAKRNGMPFNYEVCKIAGTNREQYILMGFALPDDEAALTAPLRQMVDGISFSAR